MTFPSLELIAGPHRGIEVRVVEPASGHADPAGGPEAGRAPPGALLMLHGREASATEILGFAHHLRTGAWTLVAPSAAGRSWFPLPFEAPLEDNEPWLSSALAAVRAMLLDLRAAGFGRLALLGFSQGACLALETAARQGGSNGGPEARLVEAAFGLSGSLFGPLGLERGYEPLGPWLQVYTSVHEEDPRIPAANVRASAEALRGLGAKTTFVLHPGAKHLIRPADIAAVQAYLDS
jgi:phospholipase/carboxylesterase